MSRVPPSYMYYIKLFSATFIQYTLLLHCQQRILLLKMLHLQNIFPIVLNFSLKYNQSGAFWRIEGNKKVKEKKKLLKMC